MSDPAGPNGIAAIVLAAGESRRFGSDKLLHPLTLRGMTMPLAAHSLLPWFETFGPVTVIVRPGADAFCNAIETALGGVKSASIRWVECLSAAQGMAASLVCGVRANRDAAGWLIGLADMPSLPNAAITGVRDALSAGAALAAPSRSGRRGHPVGFASRYYDQLVDLKGDNGARRLLERDQDSVIEINVDDAGILADIDSPGDLRQL
ncbi:MAG TPA: nucleotidyltransferase family protein [Gallionella sp.]|nr:nucleotidyltransferase family protein [Gallionella sp.]